jgi:hypothetical protein
MFEKPRIPADKILVLSYSNQGLDVSKAIMSDHSDIWYISAKPFDRLLSIATNQAAIGVYQLLT